MAKAMYAFSGDPITFGHIDIIQRASLVFDHVIVGIGVNPQKQYTFSLEERTRMAKQSLTHIPNVEVVSFSGLLVDYAYENGVSVIVKGVRNGEDFNYENILHQVGESQKLGIDTFILFAKPALGHVSSSAVKEIQKNHGFIHEYVPLFVKQQLEARLSGQYIIGVTGQIGAGKSHISTILTTLGQSITVHNIELDHIGHQILGSLKEPAYQNLRQELAAQFGSEIIDTNGFINRKTLGEITFRDIHQLKKLNKMLYTPLTVRLRREFSGKKGLILINAALLAETDMIHLCNNNIILIKTDDKTQRSRLEQRNLTPEQIKTRIASQYNDQQKQLYIKTAIERDGHGRLWEIDNSNNTDTASIQVLLNQVMDYFGIV